MSADHDKEKREISRFVKKQSMFAISECDSNQEGEDGYLSDPTHVANDKEYSQLYKVNPNLKKEFDVPLRDKIKPHDFQKHDRM